MSKVTHINGHSIASSGEPREDVVALLEALLDLARAGDITGVACAVQHSDGSSGRDATGSFEPIAMVGQLDAMKHTFLGDMTR